MSKPLDELYFTWLCNQVGNPFTNPNRTYLTLFRQLFTKEFVWIIPNDDNRIADGKDLRYDFAGEMGLTKIDETWMALGCSMFELLVGLSRRLAFQCDGEPSGWFWQLIENIGLGAYTDERFGYRYKTSDVDSILENIIWRNYDRNGNGGIFPLKNPKSDQRKIEIWHQMFNYINEF